jgi:hypothetical protein
MTLTVGTRIRLIAMPDDPCPVPTGTEGTIDRVEPAIGFMKLAYGVKWDGGRTLKVLDGVDTWEIIE